MRKHYLLWMRLQDSRNLFLKFNEFNCNASLWIDMVSGMIGLWLHGYIIIILAIVSLVYGVWGYETI